MINAPSDNPTPSRPQATRVWQAMHTATGTPSVVGTPRAAGEPTIPARWLSPSANYPRELGTLGRLLAHPAARIVTPITLYILAALVLLINLGGVPDYAYNWESYTARDVFLVWDGQRTLSDSFVITDGLMTDSGKSPLSVFPTWLVFQLADVGLLAMRLPLALLSAAAVPLVWLLGRRLFDERVGLFAALALLVSPAFLVYGRTATVVGLSVPLSVLTGYALWRCLEPAPSHGRLRVGWLLALQLLLIVGAYAYAPIRFLWLIALVLFAVEPFWRRRERSWFASALTVTLVVLPLFLVGMRATGMTEAGTTSFDFRRTITSYYSGRGEQIMSLANEPGHLRFYLEGETIESLQGRSVIDLAAALVWQNARDYVALLLDHETQPALAYYWSPDGQLYHQALVPFFLLGLLVVGVRAFRRPEDRFLLALFVGFSLPMLLTSKVHIGRLVFANVWLAIIVAVGVFWLLQFLTNRLPTLVYGGDAGRRVASSGWATAREWLHVVLVVALLASVGWATRQSYTGPLASESHEALVLERLHDVAAESEPHAIALVLSDTPGIEIESLHVATYRLRGDDHFRFVNLSTGEASPPRSNDPRQIVYVGGLADLTDTDARGWWLPGNGCDVVYLVRDDHTERFAAFSEHLTARCGAPADVRALAG